MHSRAVLGLLRASKHRSTSRVTQSQVASLLSSASCRAQGVGPYSQGDVGPLRRAKQHCTQGIPVPVAILWYSFPGSSQRNWAMLSRTAWAFARVDAAEALMEVTPRSMGHSSGAIAWRRTRGRPACGGVLLLQPGPVIALIRTGHGQRVSTTARPSEAGMQLLNGAALLAAFGQALESHELVGLQTNQH